jgi:class 3 adenylate cyclase/ABC-type transport system substrate-binding protein/outer membrane protein assembly factor BamB
VTEDTRSGEVAPPVSGADVPITVTFLFTDVEGSTQLLRRLGAREYAKVLAEHDRVLRAAIAGGGGEVVDTQGDSVFAAFSEVSRAVGAAVAAQRSLRGLVSSGKESVRVRMGLHTGTPEVSDGRYLGLDVHLAARICAAAHGGQTVVSSTVCEQVQAQGGFRVRPLGEHYLKDFDDPQPLYQVDPDGVAGKFPPLRSSVSSGDVGRFAGREDELAGAAVEAIARAARRSERRRVLGVVAAVAAIGALVAAYVLTRPTPIPVRDNSIAVLDAATGHVTADVPLASPPTALAAGPGAIWVTSGSGRSLTRISERTLTAHAPLPVKYDQRGPTDVGTGFGDIWVVNGFDRSITMVSARGTAPQVRVSLPRSLGVLGIGDSHIAISQTAVWIDNGGEAGVTRLTPTGARPVQTPELPTGAIAVGAGAVWVGGAHNYFDAGNVTELDPKTGQPVATFKVGEVDGLAVGLGHAWVTNATNGVVERLDPVAAPAGGQPVGGPVTEGRIGKPIRVGRGVQAVAADESHLWTANPLTGVISEIDLAAHDRIVWQRQIAGAPLKLVASEGRVWVAVLPRPQAPQPSGVRVALGPGDIDSVDPAVSFYGPMRQIEYASGLNLVRFADQPGSAGLRIVPDAAAALPRVSNHRRTYTFTIRPGLRFSPPFERQTVTAQTFRYTLERQITINSAFGGFLRYEVVGASRFLKGKAPHVSGMRVRRNTISITIKPPGPRLNLLSTLALTYSSAVPINWTGPGPDGSVPSAGPYYIRSYVPNDQLILTRNPSYHGPRHGRIQEYTFLESKNPWLQVMEGHASYTPDSPPTPAQIADQIRQYGPSSPAARAGDQRVFINPSNGGTLYFLLTNTRTGPFTNTLVRKAVNEAIDRTALAATLGPRAAIVTDQYLVPGIAGFPATDAGYPLNGPDVPAARRLMRQAHVSRPIHATLLTATGTAAAARGRIITRDLKRIGIKVRTHTEPYSAVVQTGDDPSKYNLIDTNFQFAVPDPAFLLGGGGTNWGEGPYTQQFARANTLPYDRRARDFSRLDIALVRHYAPLAAYGYGTHIDYFADGIRGQTFQPYFGIDYTRLYKARS